MTTVQVNVVRAFVEQGGEGGNPAGVVLDLEGRLSAAERLAVAAKAGFSETAFVSPSQACDYRLEFFTPTRQIPHCGHATIGTFGVLAQQGLVKGPNSSKETVDGPRRIILDGSRAFMEQRAPKYRLATEYGLTTEAIMSAIGLTTADLLEGTVPELVNTGNGFLIIGVKDQAALRKIKPNLPAIAEMTKTLDDAVAFYVFAPSSVRPGRHATARMFGPGYGIPEEAATGMAAGPLAAYLYDRLGVRQETLLIEQGYFMDEPSPSIIEVRLTLVDGKIQGLMAGGAAAVEKVLNIEIA